MKVKIHQNLRFFYCRKRPTDDSIHEFEDAMRNIFRLVMNASGEFLCKQASDFAGIDGREMQFAERVCESMVALGSSYMHCISQDDNSLSQFVQQVI